MPEHLITTHHRLALSLDCDCFLCRDWQEKTKRSQESAGLVPRHVRGCKCKGCKDATQAKITSLVAEYRLNLWIELCWYAEEEAWNKGWAEKAWKLVRKGDEWWVTTGQYVPMERWLPLFERFGAKERKRKFL